MSEAKDHILYHSIFMKCLKKGKSNVDCYHWFPLDKYTSTFCLLRCIGSLGIILFKTNIINLPLPTFIFPFYLLKEEIQKPEKEMVALLGLYKKRPIPSLLSWILPDFSKSMWDHTPFLSYCIGEYIVSAGTWWQAGMFKVIICFKHKPFVMHDSSVARRYLAFFAYTVNQLVTTFIVWKKKK